MANPYYQSSVPPYLGQPTTVPNYTQMQPTMQPQQQTNSLLTIFVNSEEEVNYYPVAAGVTVLLVSFNLGKFYVKSTGKNGVPEPLRVFNFTEETTHMVNQNEGQFVTKSDLDAVTDKLNKLIESLGGGEESEMMYGYGMHGYGNMYGGYGGYGDPMMMDGYSERRGRSPVTGRYVSRGMDGGYSGHSIEDRMIASLEQQMDGAKSDYERKVIMDEINRIRTGTMNNR